MTFDDFWSRYPRRVAKLEAAKAWKQMTRDYQPDEIIAGLERNLASLSRRERQFIPHPATWLRAGRWMDEPEAPAQPRNYADFARGLFADGPASSAAHSGHVQQLQAIGRRH